MRPNTTPDWKEPVRFRVETHPSLEILASTEVEGEGTSVSVLQVQIWGETRNANPMRYRSPSSRQYEQGAGRGSQTLLRRLVVMMATAEIEFEGLETG